MKLKQLLILLSLIVILVSCSPNDTNLDSNTTNNSSSFHVAMLFPRTIDADGWNQSGYEGLKLIESELGAQIAFSEAVPEEDFEQVFRQYAMEEYDFIIGHGGQFVDAAETVAAEFPRTRFAVMSIYEGNNRNLGSMSLQISEVAYLTGVIAALKTETKRVGFLSGTRNSVNEEIALAYEMAVTAMDSDIEVFPVWTGSWTDEASARAMTQELIDKDVDVIVVVAGQVAPLVHHIAEDAGVYTIGWTVDQYEVAPDSVLVSVVENIPQVLLHGATLARRGQWQGQQYLFGMEDNALYLTSFRDSLTAEQQALVEDTRNAILAGEIDTTP